ncbi:MAG: DNA primase [Planctomycetaceae bacterium]|nr:DNA primase [Planctomycetaceae bacterium]
MLQGFGADFKELVRSNTSLVDLVSEVVSLKPLKGGTDFIGLCPFHDDHNPSFHVYPDRQSYRCWVCDQGGDCFRWVMEIDKVSFPEAVEHLARRASLEIPKQARQQIDPQKEQRKADALAILDWAVDLMHRALLTGETAREARDYVASRGLSDETIRNFRLGYHPEKRNWFVERAHGRFTPGQLQDAGLVAESDYGPGYYDILTGRLVFPILDERGRAVAFGGRVLPGSNSEGKAKYWNSRESRLFHKSRMLYAFDRARAPIGKFGTVIVVEGYMDVIACHQAGVENVVATLGTALTEEHVRFLRRFAKRVVLNYDGDTAGQNAAERSIGRFAAQDVDLRVMTLPDGMDPADFLEKYSRNDFLQLVDGAPEAWEYKLHAAMGRTDQNSVAGREDVLAQMLELLSAFPAGNGGIREDMILRRVCSQLQVDERKVRGQLKLMRDKDAQRTVLRNGNSQLPQKTPETIVVQSSATGVHVAERELLEIVMTRPDLVDFIQHHIGSEDFEHPQYRQLLELCLDIRKEDGDLPELGRLVSAADSDAGLLSLINAVVDSADEKGVFQLMAGQPQGHQQEGGGEIPLYLERVLHPLLQRREKKLHLVSKQKMAQTNASTSELDDDTKDALRRLYRFRQQQMGHPSTLK